MQTISKNIQNEIIIKNSRFIAIIYHIDNETEVTSYLNNIKNNFKNATHYCYAYIIDNIKRFNDDGEPSGTAGMPILNVLEKNNLNNVLCIVIRYFGGIKLGAGGLIRAYGKSAREAIKLSNLEDIIRYYNITITFPYTILKNVDLLINQSSIINKKYEDDIIYVLRLTDDELEIINKLKLLGIKITK